MYRNEVSIEEGIYSVKDYSLNFSLIKFDLEKEFHNVFPRVGYLVCNLFIGDSLTCRFVNYTGEQFHNNRLYITGLFSKESLSFICSNKGKGYAFKLHPVIGYHLLKIPMTEMIDKQVLVTDVLEIRSKRLRELETNERIKTINNPILQSFLWESLPDKSVFLYDPVYHAVNRLAAAKGCIRIAKLAKEYYMSERNFRRKFLERVGLTPQSYARILKMEYAIACIRKNPQVSLEEVAFRSGYYDLSHLSRDFKTRVNLSPSSLKQPLNPLVKTYFDSPSIDA